MVEIDEKFDNPDLRLETQRLWEDHMTAFFQESEQPDTPSQLSGEIQQGADGMHVQGEENSLACSCLLVLDSHPLENCRPCVWVFKEQGCNSAYACAYCHHCPKWAIKYQQRRKKQAKKTTTGTS